MIPESMRKQYNEYINSRQWKQRRAMALLRAGERCEICGISKWSKTLEVHHKTYERLGNEQASDLQVLCPECHKEEDAKRALAGKLRGYRALWDARLDGWASKVYGEDWQETQDIEMVSERFDAWIERQ